MRSSPSVIQRYMTSWLMPIPHTYARRQEGDIRATTVRPSQDKEKLPNQLSLPTATTNSASSGMDEIEGNSRQDGKTSSVPQQRRQGQKQRQRQSLCSPRFSMNDELDDNGTHPAIGQNYRCGFTPSSPSCSSSTSSISPGRRRRRRPSDQSRTLEAAVHSCFDKASVSAENEGGGGKELERESTAAAAKTVGEQQTKPLLGSSADFGKEDASADVPSDQITTRHPNGSHQSRRRLRAYHRYIYGQVTSDESGEDKEGLRRCRKERRRSWWREEDVGEGTAMGNCTEWEEVQDQEKDGCKRGAPGKRDDFADPSPAEDDDASLAPRRGPIPVPAVLPPRSMAPAGRSSTPTACLRYCRTTDADLL